LRPKLRTRTARPVYAAAFAVMLAIPATAVALTARPSQTDTRSAISAKLSRHRVGYGDRVTVRGAASQAQLGQPLELQFAAAGVRRWRSIASTTERADGGFSLRAPMKRSGRVRVVDAAGAASPAEKLKVAARFELGTHSVVVLAGRPATLRGKLLPAVAGRKVRLEGRSGDGHWHLLTTDRTGSRGGFGLRYGGADPSATKLRVHFAGDRQNTRSAEPAGALTVFEPSLASWYYDDTGATACGFQARYGVAHRTLPCGTKVTLRNGGRQVTAVVDDRGPFVSGRTWDLGINTKNALGFVGVGSIWASR
jgi:rare lipoprotein A